MQRPPGRARQRRRGRAPPAGLRGPARRPVAPARGGHGGRACLARPPRGPSHPDARSPPAPPLTRPPASAPPPPAGRRFLLTRRWPALAAPPGPLGGSVIAV